MIKDTSSLGGKYVEAGGQIYICSEGGSCSCSCIFDTALNPWLSRKRDLHILLFHLLLRLGDICLKLKCLLKLFDNIILSTLGWGWVGDPQGVKGFSMASSCGHSTKVKKNSTKVTKNST